MQPLVSVIIPIYKVEKYICECVDSVLRQRYQNLEIILVDDGSPDRCGEICEEYKKRDRRIVVIHKENGGLSDARNAGIDIAKGEYISFIDSDDYISPYFYEIVMSIFEKSNFDMVALCRGEDFWDGMDSGTKLAGNSKDYTYHECSVKDALMLMFYQKIATGAQFKICKKELFKNVRFPVGYYYEDVATTYKLFLKAEKMAVIDSKLYAYRKRFDSIIRQEFNEKKMSAVNIFNELMEKEELMKDKQLKKAVISRSFSMLFSVFLQVPYADQIHRKQLWNEIKKCRTSVLCDTSKLMRKKNKIASMVSYLGPFASYYIGRALGQKEAMGKMSSEENNNESLIFTGGGKDGK